MNDYLIPDTPIEIGCPVCLGDGCATCKGEGTLLVDPELVDSWEESDPFEDEGAYADD